MIRPQWRKATFSGTNGSCVELAPADDTVLMRDSKDPAGPVLRLTREQLAKLLTDAKAGALDHLVN